jgi:hypothetical protein
MILLQSGEVDTAFERKASSGPGGSDATHQHDPANHSFRPAARPGGHIAHPGQGLECAKTLNVLGTVGIELEIGCQQLICRLDCGVE